MNITLDDYIKIIQSKTSALFSASTKTGAMLCDTSLDNIQLISNYAHNLGTAFQIMDDVLDYISTVDNLGKDIGIDFNEGKITLPIILCLEKCTTTEKEKLTDIFENLNIQDGDFEITLGLLNKYNCINHAIYYAEDYIEKAIEDLDNINVENEYKEALKNIAFSSVSRNF